MALQENYATGDDGFTTVLTASWKAQTFTPVTGHTITGFSFRMYRTGSPGTIDLGITEVDGSGLPTGANLASGTTDANTLLTNTAGAFRRITLITGFPLQTGTKYAAVLKALSADGSNTLYLREDRSSPTYAGGAFIFSNDSGSSWSEVTARDYMFKEYSGASEPTVTIQPATAISGTTATGNGTITDLGDSSVTAHGYVWNTAIDPDTGDSKTDEGAGILGAFTSSITGLTVGQKYYFRAYATNGEGTAYSANITFTTGYPNTQLIDGNFEIVETRLHYVGKDGKERWLEGTLV